MISLGKWLVKRSPYSRALMLILIVDKPVKNINNRILIFLVIHVFGYDNYLNLFKPKSSPIAKSASRIKICLEKSGGYMVM